MPPKLFNKIIKKRLKIQWVWPGVETGLKFILNSDDKENKKFFQNFTIVGLLIQNIEGKIINTNSPLVQFIFKFNQFT